jgi:hypothetical protein
LRRDDLLTSPTRFQAVPAIVSDPRSDSPTAQRHSPERKVIRIVPRAFIITRDRVLRVIVRLPAATRSTTRARCGSTWPSSSTAG